VFQNEGYDSLAAAIQAYLERFGRQMDVSAAAFSVAGPVGGDAFEFTNSPWTFSKRHIRKTFGLERLEVINDFAAIALAMPHLSASDVRKIGRGRRVGGAPIAVLGPGTGLGVSCLVPTGSGFRALASEGGHVTLAPFNDYESGIAGLLRARFGHVSAERALSGPGLENLYRAISSLEGHPARNLAATTISRRAQSGECAVCSKVVNTFSQMLGTAASDLALSVGALGGVFIAGGVVPKMGTAFNARKFRRRFEDKGRLSDYLRQIPTYVVTHPTPALIGLAHLLD